MSTSYKVQCWDSKSDTGPGASNALRFATEDEAKAYGAELFSRWMGLARYEVQPSEDPITYRFDFDAYRAVSIS